MTFTIEAKVAAAVAVAFAVLSIGAIARENSERGTAGLNQVSLSGSMISLSESHGGTSESEALGLY